MFVFPQLANPLQDSFPLYQGEVAYNHWTHEKPCHYVMLMKMLADNLSLPGAGYRENCA